MSDGKALVYVQSAMVDVQRASAELDSLDLDGEQRALLEARVALQKVRDLLLRKRDARARAA